MPSQRLSAEKYGSAFRSVLSVNPNWKNFALGPSDCAKRIMNADRELRR
jgi:hypothetical protein